MESARLIQTSLSVFLLLSLSVSYVHCQATRVGFYSKTCPRAESFVRSTVQTHFQSNPTVAPALLRMHFHDCFVQGCDASVLIDGPNTEKTAPPNLGLRGYEVIDDAKTQLEAECPDVVSCADILALAARDSVVLTDGPNWLVPTGRRDGRVSLASDTINFPGFTDSVDVQKQKFSYKGLNAQDLVTLVARILVIGWTALNLANILQQPEATDQWNDEAVGFKPGSAAAIYMHHAVTGKKCSPLAILKNPSQQLSKTLDIHPRPKVPFCCSPHPSQFRARPN